MSQNRNSLEKLIAALSPAAFVGSMILLAVHWSSEEIIRFAKSSYPTEAIAGLEQLMRLTWVGWPVMAASIFITLGIGFGSIKSNVAALLLGVCGAIIFIFSQPHLFSIPYFISPRTFFISIAIMYPLFGCAFNLVMPGKNGDQANAAE